MNSLTQTSSRFKECSACTYCNDIYLNIRFYAAELLPRGWRMKLAVSVTWNVADSTPLSPSIYFFLLLIYSSSYKKWWCLTLCFSIWIVVEESFCRTQLLWEWQEQFFISSSRKSTTCSLTCVLWFILDAQTPAAALKMHFEEAVSSVYW